MFKEKTASQRGRNCNEKFLFHGTSEENIDSICKYGLKSGLCGKNGVALGHGVYFAINSWYSHKYTNEAATGATSTPTLNKAKKKMFKVRVVVGKSCLGDPSYKQPPDGFDSTTDASQILICCFDDAQFYPEYVITYSTSS